MRGIRLVYHPQTAESGSGTARKIGVCAYNREQAEKVQILNQLLEHYNDGRRKTFFCLAVNLLELSELREPWSSCTPPGNCP